MLELDCFRGSKLMFYVLVCIFWLLFWKGGGREELGRGKVKENSRSGIELLIMSRMWRSRDVVEC